MRRFRGRANIVINYEGRLTGVLSILGEELCDLETNLTVGELDVVLGLTRVIHEGEETVVNVKLL
jgi:hypothetical protein